MFLLIVRNKSSIVKPLLRRTLTNFVERGLSSNRNENHYDIIITGGGMIGTTLACTLGKNAKLANKHILLLEAGKQKVWSLPEKYSNRVVSINPGTYKLLNYIGAWKHIEASRYAAVKRLQVWDAVSDASITFGEEENTDNVSYIVENDLLIAAVNEEVKTVDKVKIQYNARVKDYHLPEYHENVTQITLDNGDTYTCELL
ncbi:ubiquinone biosynthesis monooxygenase COQ6, mitochondrial-like [Anoplophora glabripennis]|nr:ubiquinone biosynthesis monooxygenase COQ6, mitochondrial-like [Anoplophora glabripennis]